MLSWIAGNSSTILVCAVLLAIVAVIITFLIKNKKKSKSSCYGCGTCPMSGTCHQKNNLEN